MRSASKPENTKTGGARNIISDKLLVEKTGQPLEHWFSELDRKGAQDLPHAAIFKLVSSLPPLQDIGEWNRNLLTTSYEWSRGLRSRGEKKPGDFEASASKIINVPLK